VTPTNLLIPNHAPTAAATSTSTDSTQPTYAATAANAATPESISAPTDTLAEAVPLRTPLLRSISGWKSPDEAIGVLTFPSHVIEPIPLADRSRPERKGSAAGKQGLGEGLGVEEASNWFPELGPSLRPGRPSGAS
jgi:hypothetical protein